MPKMKSHSGAKKRFRVTASGRVQRAQTQGFAPSGSLHGVEQRSSHHKVYDSEVSRR